MRGVALGGSDGNVRKEESAGTKAHPHKTHQRSFRTKASLHENTTDTNKGGALAHARSQLVALLLSPLLGLRRRVGRPAVFLGVLLRVLDHVKNLLRVLLVRAAEAPGDGVSGRVRRREVCVVHGIQVSAGLDQHTRDIRMRVQSREVQSGVALRAHNPRVAEFRGQHLVAAESTGWLRQAVAVRERTDLCFRLTSAPKLSSSRVIFALALSADQWMAA